MGLFDGKVAIVTGAGRGIGRAHALLFAHEGAAVVANDLGGDIAGAGADATPAQEVVAEINGNGGRAIVNGASVSSWKGAQEMIEQAVDTFGRLDVLVNNAGILRDKMSFNMDEAEWDSVVDVHLKGHFAPSRFAASYWRGKAKESGEPQNAKIVNTASESGLYGNAGQANYAAAKAGIAAMTIVMARELERSGVRVNAVTPTARTRLTDTVATGGFMDKKEGEFDRFAPENISAVVAWLASDLSEGVTGQVVKVMGGQVQLLTGWRPVTQAESDKEWTVQSFGAAAESLFAKTGKGVPVFMPPVQD
ncbi:MAG TPA: SDR family oxidoreductase [Acidimicrobiia bacterium]|nr:SDR family oxidoreductase [Acidimicrobiia bacterium]